MSTEWKERQRRTNRLVRYCCAYILSTGELNATKIRALCQLTWITKSEDIKSTAYVQSAKKPALGTIFESDYAGYSLKQVAEDIKNKTNDDLPFVLEMVENHTGFTNYYNSYRNSCLRWIQRYFRRIEPMISSAFSLTSHADASKLAAAIDRLPQIPNPSGSQSMAPANLLTPLFFSLDERLRFPVINKADHITGLLKELGVGSSSLVDRHNALVGLIGEGEIEDAVDLDCMRGLPQSESESAPTSDGKPLTIKDEADYKVLKKNTSIIAKRVHNSLTNSLISYGEEKGLEVVEGDDKSCRFDALIKGFLNKQDMLIEAKSSTERADVRMAIGQLYDYRRVLADDSIKMGVLLPSEPDQEVKSLLEYAGIYLLYFSDDILNVEGV